VEVGGNRCGLGGIQGGMGIFRRRQPVLVTVHNRPLRCVVCGTGEFWDREVKLNSTGMELLDLGWANQSALGLLCANCGFVHQFVGDAVNLWKRDQGYPDQRYAVDQGYPAE
jgi:hypothetical protein